MMAEKGNPDVRFPVTDLFSYCYFDVAAFPSSAPTGLVPRRPLHLSRWSLGGTSCRMVFCELSAELHVNAGGQLQAYIHFCSAAKFCSQIRLQYFKWTVEMVQSDWTATWKFCSRTKMGSYSYRLANRPPALRGGWRSAQLDCSPIWLAIHCLYDQTMHLTVL